MKTRKQTNVTRRQFSITKEINYIIRRAQANDGRIVQLGRLVLFSTQTGDAWVLDPDDELALCVARNGEREDYEVLETETNYQIHWNAKYKIQNDMFVVISHDGRMRSIFGYPTKEIREITNAPKQ